MPNRMCRREGCPRRKARGYAYCCQTCGILDGELTGLQKLLESAPDDRQGTEAWTLLVDVITDDPCATHEYKVAAHMLGHLAEVTE